jgi:hypothetical protein
VQQNYLEDYEMKIPKWYLTAVAAYLAVFTAIAHFAS